MLLYSCLLYTSPDLLEETQKTVRLFFAGLLLRLLFVLSHVLRSLLSFPVQGVFPAEPAVFIHLKPVGIVLLVFLCVVVSLLALSAGQNNLDSHLSAPPVSRKKFEVFSPQPPSKKGTKKEPLLRGTFTIAYVCLLYTSRCV